MGVLDAHTNPGVQQVCTLFYQKFYQMKKFIFFLILITCVFANKVNAQLTGIAINDDGSKADTSAILDVNVNSTTPKRGFLLPRITTTER